MHHGLDSLLYTATALVRSSEPGNLLLGRASYQSTFAPLKSLHKLTFHIECVDTEVLLRTNVLRLTHGSRWTTDDNIISLTLDPEGFREQLLFLRHKVI